MRITTALSSLGSILLAEFVNAAATVYLRPSTTTLGQLTAPEADVLLANHLGVERTAALDDEELASLMEKAGGQLAVGKALLDSPDDSLLVVVDADDAYISELIPDSWSSPSFTISVAPSSLSALIESYTHSAFHSDFSVYDDLDSEYARAPKRYLDLFDFATDSAPMESFLKSFDALVDFVENRKTYGRRFGAFHISQLAGIAEEFGEDSDAFHSILMAVKATLSNPALDSQNVAVIVSSPDMKASTRRGVDAAEGTQAPFPLPPPGNAPIYSSSTCFTSAAACSDGTTDCSGRGQCVPVRKGPRECYICQCAVTFDSKNRTEYWSGSACQTKDVSMEFTLITSTAIGVVLVIIFAITLLYRVGSEELPNVLTGGAVHKRE